MRYTFPAAPGLLAMLLCGVTWAAGEPFFVDLRAVANSDLEDDGVAGNGKGGWTDEGINDMYVYPPLEFGEVRRNGYRFRLIDPKENDGRAVIILAGQNVGPPKPGSLTARVPKVKGRYVYFLQNATRQIRPTPKAYRVATYTVSYEDGSSAQIPIRDGIEIRQWYTNPWYKNSEEKAWPIFTGRNSYSGKWGYYIGVWAMQWRNPRPEQALTAITFRSEGRSVPIIFAVTITDEDYFHGPDVKKHFKAPPPAPDGYFDVKTEQEREPVFQAMIDEKLVEGVRGLDLIAPDLLALTLDAVVAEGPGLGEKRAAALQKPERFTVSAPGDPEFGRRGVRPVEVGRLSLRDDTRSAGPFPGNRIYKHTYYLRLPSPLREGERYTVAVSGLRRGFKSRVELTYRAAETVTPAIKVNQSAYSPAAGRRYAYLGWWAGDLGKVDYSMFKTFHVVDEDDGQTVLEGEITLRRADDEISGEDVYEMDLAPLTEVGRYHIFIPGLGRSFSFGLGGKYSRNNYYVCMRGVLHQRCGCELTEEITVYPRRACHVRSYENGHLVGGGSASRPGEPLRSFYGGYHDAADSDLHYHHLKATADLLTTYALAPDLFKADDLRVPESGNGIPDILDEAAWGLKFYADYQQPDGGVPGGRLNDEDDVGTWREGKWAKQFGELPPYGNYPPCNASSNTFAAVAAQFSRAIRPFDARKADRFLVGARRAYAWAKGHKETDYELQGPPYGRIFWKRAWAWAAIELFITTGEDAYHRDFLALVRDPETYSFRWAGNTGASYYPFPYAAARRRGIDPEVQGEMRRLVIQFADRLLRFTDAQAYRLSGVSWSGSWGMLGGGERWANPLLRAYLLTKDRRYLDAASLDADFQLGANPLSRSFMTGAGSRPPVHPEVRAWLYTAEGVPSPGFQVFGPASDPKKLGPRYPLDVPPWRCWLDDRVAAMYSESGINRCGGNAMLYGVLHALEKK